MIEEARTKKTKAQKLEHRLEREGAEPKCQDQAAGDGITGEVECGCGGPTKPKERSQAHP